LSLFFNSIFCQILTVGLLRVVLKSPMVSNHDHIISLSEIWNLTIADLWNNRFIYSTTVSISLTSKCRTENKPMSVITSALLFAASRCLNIGFSILNSSTTSHSCNNNTFHSPLENLYQMVVLMQLYNTTLQTMVRMIPSKACTQYPISNNIGL